MNTAPIQVQTIDHLTLIVKDLKSSRQFYVDLLGMQEVPRPNFAFKGCWFQAGSTLIHVILEFEESGPAGNNIAPNTTISRTQHFAFIVNDPMSAVPHLRAAKVPIVAGPKQRPDGATQVFIQDPDGYVIELCNTLDVPQS